MNKIFALLLYYFVLLFIPREYLYASSRGVNEVTSGINSLSRAFGDAALNIKRAYDQIDSNSIRTNYAIADGDARTKMLEAKLQAVIDSVKKWMTTDSNTKQEALQTLQRNTEVIGNEVNKAKRQLENANNAANNASAADKPKFNNEIQASANAVSANSQYYMATKTRFDYEKKYKEMIDERNKRLDMVQKVDDPQTLRELLSDSTDIGGKKYGTQLGDYTNADIKLRNNLPQQTTQNAYSPNNFSYTRQNTDVSNRYNERAVSKTWFNAEAPNVPLSRSSSWHASQQPYDAQGQYEAQNQYGTQPQYQSQYNAQVAYGVPQSYGNGQFVDNRNNYIPQYSNQNNWGQNFVQSNNYVNNNVATSTNNGNFIQPNTTSNLYQPVNQKLASGSDISSNKNIEFGQTTTRRKANLSDILAPLSYDSN